MDRRQYIMDHRHEGVGGRGIRVRPLPTDLLPFLLLNEFIGLIAVADRGIQRGDEDGKANCQDKGDRKDESGRFPGQALGYGLLFAGAAWLSAVLTDVFRSRSGGESSD